MPTVPVPLDHDHDPDPTEPQARCSFCRSPATVLAAPDVPCCDRCRPVVESDVCGCCGEAPPIKMLDEWPACVACIVAAERMQLEHLRLAKLQTDLDLVASVRAVGLSPQRVLEAMARRVA